MQLQQLLTSYFFSSITKITNPASLPVVDLGYELYRASGLDSNGIYNFSNIRYARPPTGQMRFRAPEVPVIDRSVIKDEKLGRMCPQASPAQPSASQRSRRRRFPEETEDCLFLDVFVPQRVFQRTAASQSPGAPVYVWIHDGSYIQGVKAHFNDPSGLIARSQMDNGDGLIYVAINYRLGGFGWLSGPSLQRDGTANAGLYDQRMALEWIQENIHRFGGDKNRVTVTGLSAGGGSIINHLTASGGTSKRLFQRAIVQSPTWFVLPSMNRQEHSFRELLRLANASSLDALRSISSEKLMDLNSAIVGDALVTQLPFGPAVDFDIIKQNPNLLLAQGKFDSSIEILTGYVADEGMGIIPPNVTSDADVSSFLEQTFPAAATAVLSYISDVLYPPVSSSTSYRTNTERLEHLLADAFFKCNTVALSCAFRNQTYAYMFAVPPASHGSDYPYVYYVPSSEDVNAKIATALQDYLVHFAISGHPSTSVPGAPKMNHYGSNSSVVRLDSSGISIVQDPAANERCGWWKLASFE